MSLAGFEAELRDELAREAEAARIQLEFFSRLNFYVFPFGIFLALLGQVAKVKVQGGDEWKAEIRVTECVNKNRFPK
jgi:hypothetical protein